MPRAMWRGAIQFGLVTVPVKLYLATEARGGLSFNLLHKPDMERINMKVHCPIHGEIPRSETVRGYEYAKGQYVVIEESDFDAVPLKTVRAIEIEQFVEASRDSATTFVKQAYYLEPDPVARKAFYLLKEVLADEGLSAICKIVLKDREALASLNPFSNTMLLSTLYWPDELRSTAELDLPDEDFKFKPSEKAMAKQLVAAMRGEFDPANYEDEYRKSLEAVIAAKVDGQPVVAHKVAEKPTKIADLMSILEASVAAARDAKAGRGAAAAKPAAKKAAAKPAPAKPAAKAKATTPRAKAAAESKPKAKRKAA